MTDQSKRFIVVYDDEVEKYNDPEGLYDVYMENDFCGPSYLVDTETDTIVFCDRMEPEDASLGRSLFPLVQLLNNLAASSS